MVGERKKLVVIGGDAAGLSAASAVRRIKKDWEIVVYEKGPYISYASCGIPYYIAGWVKDEQSMITVSRDEFIEQRKIKVEIHREVMRVDTARKSVEVKNLEDGSEFTDTWDHLVIATGAITDTIPVPGVDHPKVFVVKDLQDGVRVRSHVRSTSPSSVVIIGGSYIGLEMAEGFKEAGVTDITIIKRSPRFLPACPTQVSDLIVDELTRKGIHIITQVKIGEIKDIAGNKLEISFQPAPERPVLADMVLIATGVKPNTGFLEGSGIALDDRGAVDVDRNMRSNVPCVWAAGDCANVFNSITGQKVYYPLATVANKQGRYAGYNIAGNEIEFPGTMETIITKVFDLSVGRTGLTLEKARDFEFPAIEVSITHRDMAHYYPGSGELFMSIVVDTTERTILGATVAGKGMVAKRVDTLVALIAGKVKLENIQMLDFAYAPPFSPVYDAISIVASVAMKKVK